MNNKSNVDEKVVSDFGSEWSRFDQTLLTLDDHNKMFDDYFHFFPWSDLPEESIGADIGCGSGRWAGPVANRVGHLKLIDASSEALAVAYKNLGMRQNISFICASVDDLKIEESSLDFAYSLGVLHHIPDTLGGLISIARYLKPRAPFLVYLYYNFENRSNGFICLWKLSNLLRKLISKSPENFKHFACEIIALSIYFPLARIGLLLDKFGVMPNAWPLSYYRRRSYYVMRTDALDRFGTSLEKRFSRQEITYMMESAGFINIRFSDRQPFWTVIGFKK